MEVIMQYSKMSIEERVSKTFEGFISCKRINSEGIEVKRLQSIPNFWPAQPAGDCTSEHKEPIIMRLDNAGRLHSVNNLPAKENPQTGYKVFAEHGKLFVEDA